jgi:AraC family transcriptional regulator, ethanolamine operon transcriptional activator
MVDASIQRNEFAEVDELMSGLQGMAATAVPLRCGRHAATLSTANLGDVALQVVRGAPMLVLGSSEKSSTGLVQVLEGSEHARWNGRSIESNEISVYDEGGQHEAVYFEEFACTFLRLPAAWANGASALLGRSCDGPGFGARADPVARSALAAIARAVEHATTDSSSALRDTEARRSLRAEILDTAQTLLDPADVNRGRRARDVRTRQRIVRAAEDYLRANAARPVYTEDLCTAIGTSATRLHQAFDTTFGISPHRYLKLRKMSMVRAALLSRCGPWRSVKAAALSHGFWHLGQFARDYRTLFGEAPSHTLASAAADPPATEARSKTDGARPLHAAAADMEMAQPTGRKGLHHSRPLRAPRT